MSMRELGIEKIRKITEDGKTSYVVTLPIEIVENFNWRENQKVKLEIDEMNNKIIISDWMK